MFNQKVLFELPLVKWGFICSKTGRLRPISRISKTAQWLFPVTGFLCLIWFLLRVIPKPSRASYPCMRATAPVASGFVAWLAAIPVVSPVWEKTKKRLHGKGRIIINIIALLLIVLPGFSFLFCRSVQKQLPDAVLEPANHPIGNALGIFPGRVVWVWNPDATNEQLTNRPGDGWFLPQNNNQAVIDRMLSDGLHTLSGQDTDAAAWDAVFKFHNAGRGISGGYTPGEKIFIKINAVSTWTGNYNPADLSIAENQFYGMAETNPALVLSVLRQLINTVGAAQTDIYVGDPMKHIYKHAYTLWHAEFPAVHYLDRDFGAEAGREQAAFTNEPAIFYSDKGKILKTGSWENPTAGPPAASDKLCSLFGTADYLINIPAMKGHKRAGISMFAKNHFGSNDRENALHLHEGLVNPTEKEASRQEYKNYRVQVDLMGHKWLGGKNLFYLMDALYAGPESIYPPTKWQTTPFNNDWTSSLFLSQDPVAIESVGYDFLRSEYTRNTPYNWVQMQGVDDYLHQAADCTARPSDIVYDPEDDGTSLGSLGVHEHWNNAREKQYSHNLGTGSGIELLMIKGKNN